VRFKATDVFQYFKPSPCARRVSWIAHGFEQEVEDDPFLELLAADTMEIAGRTDSRRIRAGKRRDRLGEACCCGRGCKPGRRPGRREDGRPARRCEGNAHPCACALVNDACCNVTSASVPRAVQSIKRLAASCRPPDLMQ